MGTTEARLAELERAAAAARVDEPIALTDRERAREVGLLLSEYQNRCPGRDYPPADPEVGSLAHRAQRLLVLLERAKERKARGEVQDVND